MNSRLEDLMYRAGLTAQGCWDSMDDYDQKAIEKFAELIVRECAEIVEETRWMVPPSQEQIARSIKQHFGVEE